MLELAAVTQAVVCPLIVMVTLGRLPPPSASATSWGISSPFMGSEAQRTLELHDLLPTYCRPLLPAPPQRCAARSRQRISCCVKPSAARSKSMTADVFVRRRCHSGSLVIGSPQGLRARLRGQAASAPLKALGPPIEGAPQQSRVAAAIGCRALTPMWDRLIDRLRRATPFAVDAMSSSS
jgi:hypothetical protein